VELSIQSLTPQLAPHFESLNREWIERYFVIEAADEEILTRPEGIIADGGVVLFACEGQDVIGTGALIRLDETTAEIAKMAVRPGQRGNGVGGRLLRALLDAARDRGFRQLRIETSSRLPAANALYQKYGFTRDAAATSQHDFARADVFYTLQLVMNS